MRWTSIQSTSCCLSPWPSTLRLCYRWPTWTTPSFSAAGSSKCQIWYVADEREAKALNSSHIANRHLPTFCKQIFSGLVIKAMSIAILYVNTHLMLALLNHESSRLLPWSLTSTNLTTNSSPGPAIIDSIWSELDSRCPVQRPNWSGQAIFKFALLVIMTHLGWLRQRSIDD